MELKMSKQPKIAVATTFPNSYFGLCAAEMLATFKAYWPEDIKMYIQLDEQPEEDFHVLNNAIIDVLGEDRAFIAGMWDDDQKEFLERWKDHEPESYMDNVVRFSHKVFALEKCADAIKDDIDYLIWLDADVITKSTIDYEWLKGVLPEENDTVSYLGRPGLYSECGWVVYNLKNGGYDLLSDMRGMYVTDSFKALEGGWTDCHVFDACMSNGKNLSDHYIHGRTPIDVWPFTKLGERLEHRKGNRKIKKSQQQVKPAPKQQGANVGAIDANNLQIKTKNCLDHEKICGNVRTNKANIRHWATLTRPSYLNGYERPEDIVFCSAGPSLVNHIDEIKKHKEKGAFVVAVKHAIETLEAYKIQPDAVILLDPRAHVEGFVKDPDPEVMYFVSSMCDPSVVDALNKAKCPVMGYHALVNAGEVNEMIPCDLPVAGGSATATRGISLFADMFGYRTFHCYGYDLCHFDKPDLEALNDDGNPQFMELTMKTMGWKNKEFKKTFWTEGQFLAQSNEISNLYKERKDLNIIVYGDGIAGWMYKHYQDLERYKLEYNQRLETKRAGTPTLRELITMIKRAPELARGK
jgi:hypothetical protein